MTVFVTQDLTIQSGNGVTLSPGDDVFVLPDIYILDQFGYAIVGQGDGGAQIDGEVIGSGGVDFAGAPANETGEMTSVEVGAAGLVSSLNQVAVAIGNGHYEVTNLGEIDGSFGNGVELDYNPGTDSQGYGGGVLVNTGTIDAAGAAGVLIGDTNPKDDTLFDDSVTNAGTISGAEGVNDLGANYAVIDNSGEIIGQSLAVNTTGAASLSNSGKISGGVTLGQNSSVSDSGTIDGSVLLAGGTVGVADVAVAAAGIISGAPGGVALQVQSGPFHIVNDGEILAGAKSPGARVAAGVVSDGGGSLINRGTIATSDGEGIINFAARELDDYVYNYGTISSSGVNFHTIYDQDGHRDTIINYGAIDASATGYAIYSDATSIDLVDNVGDITGEVDLGAPESEVVNHGRITGSVYFGDSDDRVVNSGEIEGNITFAGAGNVFDGVGGEVSGTIFGGGGDGRYFSGADNETFDLSESGAAKVVGGAGSDTFIFSSMNLTSTTVVEGAVGATDDVLQFATAGALAARDFSHVSGIETIELANGTNNLAITNAMLASATGNAMTIDGGTGADTINAGGVTVSTDKLTIYGGGGADVITAGAGMDTFVYKFGGESSGPAYDTITGLNFAQDSFDIPGGIGSILAISPAVTGTLSTATFNLDLADDLTTAVLGPHDALLFTANAGTLSGQTFLVANLSGVAGYQPNADLVIKVTGATGTLTTGNFI